MFSLWRHPLLMRYNGNLKHDKLRIPNTSAILFQLVRIKLNLNNLICFAMSQSHTLVSITVLTAVYVYK